MLFIGCEDMYWPENLFKSIGIGSTIMKDLYKSTKSNLKIEVLIAINEYFIIENSFNGVDEKLYYNYRR